MAARRSAFTLTEFLIVLAAIIPLAILLIVGVCQTPDSSSRQTCAPALQQLAGSVRAYEASGGSFPDVPPSQPGIPASSRPASGPSAP